MLITGAANAVIGLLKLGAGLLTGSAAMLAEAAHSVADTATEALLLTALRRSARAPDRVAYVLGGTNKGLLIGRQANVRLVGDLRSELAGRPEVDAVVDLLTMMLGTDSVLLCARLDFDGHLGADDVERACVAIDADLRARSPDLAEIFLEPVPRTDPIMRDRVLTRYGRTLDA